ncbi:hypothetical protein SFRURICE_018386 [Spodoptera frugiperda]|uniref:SFRICE_005360 n=1 Tax=Spodoptera frugiperda TaxID=7108 RepID=A0A2H1VQF4_SPOFR|nr:hypothetical protein SFRURICE_018386 [Spodoptera frugiperda]
MGGLAILLMIATTIGPSYGEKEIKPIKFEIEVVPGLINLYSAAKRQLSGKNVMEMISDSHLAQYILRQALAYTFNNQEDEELTRRAQWRSKLLSSLGNGLTNEMDGKSLYSGRMKMLKRLDRHRKEQIIARNNLRISHPYID